MLLSVTYLHYPNPIISSYFHHADHSPFSFQIQTWSSLCSIRDSEASPALLAPPGPSLLWIFSRASELRIVSVFILNRFVLYFLSRWQLHKQIPKCRNDKTKYFQKLSFCLLVKYTMRQLPRFILRFRSNIGNETWIEHTRKEPGNKHKYFFNIEHEKWIFSQYRVATGH